MTDLHNKLGDVSTTKIALPKNLQITVRRVGTAVHLLIGNADPIVFEYRDAMRQGLAWAREGRLAVKENRPTELKIKTGRLHCDGRTLGTIGLWMLAKGSEAKLLAGDAARLQV